MGHKFIYGDTDSTLIQIPLKEALTYHEVLNRHLVDFCKQEGINRELTLKLDRHFKKIVFKKKRNQEEGAKKKYFGLVQWEDGKEVDYILVKGFEYVRRDASVVCKEVQFKIFELILRKTREDVLKYLREKLQQIRSGHYSFDDLAIPKTLHKNPNQYDSPQDYVRGALFANKWLDMGIRTDDNVKLLYVKQIKGLPYTDCISVYSYKELKNEVVPDIEKIIEKTVRAKVEDLIELIGIDWKEIDSDNKQTRMSF